MLMLQEIYHQLNWDGKLTGFVSSQVN